MAGHLISSLTALTAVLSICVVTGSGSVIAADAPPPKSLDGTGLTEPTDPVKKAAFDVLYKHCSRCHQQQLLEPPITTPQQGFDHVLELDKLAQTNFIVPGNPINSPLYQKVAILHTMPYDIANGTYTGPTTTQADYDALAAWINSLQASAAQQCTARQFIADQDIVNYILANLQAQIPARVKGMRYVTLTNLYNACTSDNQMEVYRNAIVKFLNSLSSTSTVLPITTIDPPTKTILAFNLADLGLSDADWNTVLTLYPYATSPNNSLNFTTIANQTASAIPYIRGDWLVNNASHDPLYSVLMRLEDLLTNKPRNLA